MANPFPFAAPFPGAPLASFDELCAAAAQPPPPAPSAEDAIEALFRSLPADIMGGGAPAAPAGGPAAFERPLLSPSEERAYVCKVCYKGFKRETNLMFHMATHRERTVDESGAIVDHKWDEPTMCPGCPRVFATKYQAKKHFLRRHFQGEKKYTCEVCHKKSFTVKEDYTMHIKSCGRVFSCTCGIQLRSQATLKRHCKLTGHEPASLDGALAPDMETDLFSALAAGPDAPAYGHGGPSSASLGDAASHSVSVHVDADPAPEPPAKARRVEAPTPDMDEAKARDILAVLGCLL